MMTMRHRLNPSKKIASLNSFCETINRLQLSTQIIFFASDSKALRMRHVDFFLEVFVEERCLDIYLNHFYIFRGDNSKNQADLIGIFIIFLWEN